MFHAPARKIAFEKLTPAFLLGLRRLRKAVARQVDEIQCLVQQKEIDQPRFPRLRRGLCKLLIVCETVDEARFADVRLSDDRDLARERFGILPAEPRACDKFRLSDDELLFHRVSIA